MVYKKLLNVIGFDKFHNKNILHKWASFIIDYLGWAINKQNESTFSI